jgi:hypothetical protein
VKKYNKLLINYKIMVNNSKKVTSKKVAKKASKILKNETSTKAEKSVAGSALSQTPNKVDKKKKIKKK